MTTATFKLKRGPIDGPTKVTKKEDVFQKRAELVLLLESAKEKMQAELRAGEDLIDAPNAMVLKAHFERLKDLISGAKSMYGRMYTKKKQSLTPEPKANEKAEKLFIWNLPNRETIVSRGLDKNHAVAVFTLSMYPTMPKKTLDEIVNQMYNIDPIVSMNSVIIRGGKLNA